MGIIGNTLQLINNIKLPAGTQGYMRSEMPQIDSKQISRLKEFLKDNDVEFYNKKIKVNKLKLTQNEVNKMKIFKMMQLIRKKKGLKGRILVSGDQPFNFVLDGSHRFAAYYNMSEKKYDSIDAMVIDLPVRDAVELLNTFSGVKHRTASDSKLTM